MATNDNHEGHEGHEARDVADPRLDGADALGPGYLESIYRKAMAIELDSRRVPFERERAVDVIYREIPIPGQRVDLIVDLRALRGYR